MGTVVDSTAPLMAAGLDSLAAIELKNAVSNRFSVTLPATLAFDYPTLEALSHFIATKLTSSAKPEAGTSQAPRVASQDLCITNQRFARHS